MKVLLGTICLLVLLYNVSSHKKSVKTWECVNGGCVSNLTDGIQPPQSINVCKITCLDGGGLWPLPTGTVSLSKALVPINVFSIVSHIPGSYPAQTVQLLTDATNLFLQRLQNKSIESNANNDGRNLVITYTLSEPEPVSLVNHLDESYQISLLDDSIQNQIIITITSKNFFGARHGLETLAQLIIYDDIENEFKILDQAQISDAPVYTFRGLHLDSARTYFSVAAIKRTIDTMSLNKLNNLHWHITDTHSFPYVSAKRPILSQVGAYGKNKIYTPSDVKDLVEYARVRGVRIIPEFDAPAHVGEGWQTLGNLTTCFKWEPWTKYCVEPPCGQLDPTQDGVYEVLEDLYSEYAKIFDSDIFHMGGDEVNLNCWNSTDRIVQWMANNNISTDGNGFHNLWNIFQTKALEKWRKTGKTAPVILWTSSLTEVGRIDLYLDPKDYIIQIWSDKNDNVIPELVKNNFQVIFSNYDELYLDCGGPAWIGGPGNNWCSPYKGWQTVYEHNPLKILGNKGVDVKSKKIESLILGSEGAVWTEQLDEGTIDYRYWPRAAALAERLWTNPETPWTAAQYRMNNHRERIVERGIRAEQFQPEWCYENDGYCGPGV